MEASLNGNREHRERERQRRSFDMERQARHINRIGSQYNNTNDSVYVNRGRSRNNATVIMTGVRIVRIVADITIIICVDIE